MSIAEQQPSTATTSTATDPDLAKFSAGSVVHVIGDSEQRKFTVITRHYLWDHGRREHHYRLFRDCGNGRCEMTWKRESEIESIIDSPISP